MPHSFDPRPERRSFALSVRRRIQASCEALLLITKKHYRLHRQIRTKKRHLHKHKQPAEKFVDFVVSRDFSSEIARKYQKRFKKSGPKLFTFLDYDGVPWNNNNAEHAIKYFARYRTLTDGLFTEKSIQRALIMLSVFQTCEYNDTAILRFLLSNRNDLESILRSGRRGTRSSRV